MVLQNWPAPIRKAVLSIAGLQWGSRFLQRIYAQTNNAHEMLTAVFERNNFDIKIIHEELMPTEGGCIVATNHPHGFFDGLGGIWLAGRHGHDARIIARHLLSVFEPLKDLCLFIKISADRTSEKGEQIADQAAQYVAEGGRLAICSAGRLSHSRPIWIPAQDLRWKTGTVRIAKKANAPIVLVNMDMRHSVIRQLSQRIHPVLRALVQVWSYRFGRSQKLHMYVLAVVQPEDIPPGSVQEQTDWLQNKFDQLSTQPE